jgi:hypothetical protein
MELAVDQLNTVLSANIGRNIQTYLRTENNKILSIKKATRCIETM